ncbi:MAG: MATE family efflux transporter [Chloroflexota bacterium]
MQTSQKTRLIDAPVGPTLVRLTLPMIIGILAMIAFNLVDTFFVAQLGTAELAAMSFTFPVVLVIGSLAMGLGVGTSSVISRAIGTGNDQQVRRLTTDSLVLSVLIVLVFAIIGFILIDPLFRLLGATDENLPLIREYMTIWFIGMPFIVIPMVGNNAIRATGDTQTPSFVMLVAVAINIVLDPLLIFGIGPFPRLELAGAAIATVIARAVTFGVAIWVLAKREQMITFIKPTLAEVVRSWRQILYIGLPSAGTNMILPLAIGVVTSMAARHGEASIAALGVTTRIDPFAIAVIMALASVLSPFIGQNWGAGKPERVTLALKLSYRFALIWGIVMALILAVAARPIATLFSDNPDVIDLVTLYLRLVPLGYGLQGILLLSNTTLNVLRKPFHASALSLIQMFVLYIPLATLASYTLGMPGIFAALLNANIIAGVLAYLWVRRTLNIEQRLQTSLVQQYRQT